VERFKLEPPYFFSNPIVFSLAVVGTDLYAAGSSRYREYGQQHRPLDGTTWSPLGSGVNSDANALAVRGQICTWEARL